MRHFLGGWALGTIVGGFWCVSKMRRGYLYEAFVWSAIMIGPLVGLVVWGLWP